MRRLATGLVLALLAVSCSNGAEIETQPQPIVTVFGSYRGAEADAFARSLQLFEFRTGIDVQYVGSANFVDDLRQRVQSGLDEPDIAIVPQPGLVKELIAEGDLQPLDDNTRTALDDHYDPDLLTDFSADRTSVFAVPYRQTIKSIVWYRPLIFEQFGWRIPTTLDELIALANTIQDAEGIAPWCFSIASGSATGWPATDWVEDLLLRLSGPDVYDEWVSGERSFDDTAIREAFEMFDQLVIASGRTTGDLRRIVQIEVQDTNAGLFGQSPGCAMHKQANFALSWMPSETNVGTDSDVDFFVLPSVSGAAAPLVVGGDSAVLFSDSNEANTLMAFLASPAGGQEWARQGGYISGRSSVDLDEYYVDVDRRFAQLLLEDRTIRFDASDSMEPSVGSGLFWQEITNWIAGSATLDEIVLALDTARSATP